MAKKVTSVAIEHSVFIEHVAIWGIIALLSIQYYISYQSHPELP